jgi:hypothetical protein
MTLGITIALLDIATTWYALRIGASEGNPAQAWMFSQFGFWLGCALWFPVDVWRVSVAASFPYGNVEKARVSGVTLSRTAVRVIAYVAQAAILFHAFIVASNFLVIGHLLRH